jgi:uncharacterized protein YbbC (DUF1343 family)
VSFTPVDLPGKATNPKFENVEIEGISLQVTDPEVFESVTFGVILLNTLNKLYPDDFEISRPEWANRLWGQESLNQVMTGDLSMENLMMAVRQDVEDFLPLKEKYSLYR